MNTCSRLSLVWKCWISFPMLCLVVESKWFTKQNWQHQNLQPLKISLRLLNAFQCTTGHCSRLQVTSAWFLVGNHEVCEVETLYKNSIIELCRRKTANSYLWDEPYHAHFTKFPDWFCSFSFNDSLYFPLFEMNDLFALTGLACT